MNTNKYEPPRFDASKDGVGKEGGELKYFPFPKWSFFKFVLLLCLPVIMGYMYFDYIESRKVQLDLLIALLIGMVLYSLIWIVVKPKFILPSYNEAGMILPRPFGNSVNVFWGEVVDCSMRRVVGFRFVRIDISGTNRCKWLLYDVRFLELIRKYANLE